MRTLLSLTVVLLSSTLTLAADPAPAAIPDNKPIPRRLPPLATNPITAEQRKEIETALAHATARLDKLNHPLKADAEIYIKAVRFALLHDEWYEKDAAKVALDALKTAESRMDALAKNESPWTTQTGLVVRGYTSNIDGSAQPYGLEIPEHLDTTTKPVPLYVWLHGRGETETDLYFIAHRAKSHSQISKYIDNAIIVHPFGRGTLGYKSAGEIDVMDAIASVKERYKIDADRVALMGFSMGGAGAWHLGAHYTDQFCAVHAGAGFVDTQRFQKLDPATVPWYTRQLWHQYDVPDYVRNLFNVPVLCYSGEIDKQKQAGDIMFEAFKAEGRELPYIIGPNMPHKYDDASLKEIMRRMAEFVKKGRDNSPKDVHLQTRSLRYGELKNFRIVSVDRQWEDTRIDAHCVDANHFAVETRNVRSMTIFSKSHDVAVKVDGQQLRIVRAEHLDIPLGLEKNGEGKWGVIQVNDLANSLVVNPLHEKRKFQEGPIDDAFMQPFIVVTPSGKSKHPAVQHWTDFELNHFQARWRELFRGDLRMKKDTEITSEDMIHYNLILWGDADSNTLIARVAKDLPDASDKFDPATHVTAMVYLNPLFPMNYIVLNSGPTFREKDDSSNSLQNPKLPDWAVIDITTPPDAEWPGKIVAADFFDEHWQIRPPHKD